MSAPSLLRRALLRSSAALALFVPFAPLFVGACSPAPEEARLTVVASPDASDPSRPNYHDFGRVPDGERLEHTYLLHNDSPRSIAIQDIVPGCGCTVPSLTYRSASGEVVSGRSVRSGSPHGEPLLELPAGLTAELRLAIDSRGVRPKNTHRLYSTRIATDAEATAYLTIETHILVESPFQVVPEKIELGRVALGGDGEAEARIVCLSGYDKRLTGVASTTGGFEAELVETEVRGIREWVLTARLHPPVAAGRSTGVITLSSENADGTPYRTIDVGVTAFGVEDVQSEPARLILVGEAARAEPVVGSVEIYSLLGGKRLEILEAEVEPEHAERLTVDFEPLEPDRRGRSLRWRVGLTTGPPQEEEVLRGNVRLLLDDQQSPTVEIPYVVHFR